MLLALSAAALCVWVLAARCRRSRREAGNGLLEIPIYPFGLSEPELVQYLRNLARQGHDD